MLTEPTKQRCQSCGGAGGPWRAHRSRTCPNSPPRSAPPPRTTADDIAALEQVCALLEFDAAEHGLDGTSRRAWPYDLDFTAEVTIREQFQCLHYRALRLVGHDLEGRELLERIDSILNSGFTSPTLIPPAERVLVPPQAVRLAMDRLRLVRAPDDVLLSKQPPHDPDLARDWRLVWFWLDQVERER